QMGDDARAIAGRVARQRAPLEIDAARRRRPQSGDEIQHGALPSAVTTHHGDKITAARLESDAGHNRRLTRAPAQVVDAEQGCHRDEVPRINVESAACGASSRASHSAASTILGPGTTSASVVSAKTACVLTARS